MGTNVQEEQGHDTTTAWAMSALAGNYSDVGELATALQMASERCRLIGGATVGPMPLGYEAQLVVIPIPYEQTYPIKTKDGDPPRRGYGKPILMTIAHAASVAWTNVERKDDGSARDYVHMRVLGQFLQNDGTMRPLDGDCDLDFRDGSPQLGGLPSGMVQNKRANILRLAITGAKLRALREGFGVEHGALEEDLDRPFVICKFVFTGRCPGRPEMEQLFAGVIAQRQISAAAVMYGVSPALALPQQQGPFGLLGAGPGSFPSGASVIGDAGMDADDNYDPDTGEIIDAPTSAPEAAPSRPSPPPPPKKAKAPPPPPPKRQAAPTQRGGGNGGGASEITIPGGRSQGTPLHEADDKDLEYWLNRKEGELASGKSGKWADRDKQWVAAARAEQARRQGLDGGPDDDADRYQGEY